MANNIQTEYTPAELLPINKDIIDIKLDDTNYDMFNKESVLIGLLLVTKKLKKLPNEQAIHILESVSNSVQYLLKYNFNEYIIEGIRKVIDVIIEDEVDDQSTFLMEKKAEFVRIMLSKIGEL